MSFKPTVSVVIPVHNGARYLRETLESVRAQRFDAVSDDALQIVVVDDGSTDDSAQIAQSFGDIEYSHQAQSGAASARNRGVQLSRGEFIAFLDADDLWTPDKLQLQLEILESRRADMVLGQVEQFLSAEISDAESRARVPQEILPAFIPSALMMRRDDFLRVGKFQTNWEIGEFIDWFARATEIGLTHDVLPQVVLRRRIHDRNQGVTKREFQRDYVRIVKASLDRRRASSEVSSTRSTKEVAS